MDIRRFELPAASSGEAQWADIHHHPSHGMEKQIVRWSLAAESDGDPLNSEDALILTLVHEWHVLGHDGKPLPLNREGVEAAPGSIIGVLADQCAIISNGTRGDRGVSEASRRLRWVATTVPTDEKDRAKLVKLADDFDRLTSPNPKSQTA
ncbi:MAG: hypothetical protein KF809_17325 [Chloroflexi bacterium]|nr:hypothetical protein [Chloroflexota bacterium]